MDDDDAFGDFDAAPPPVPPATAEAQGFGAFSQAISTTTAPDPSRLVVTHAGGDDDAEFGAFATVETHPSPANADADADDDGFADFAEAPVPPTPPAADDDFGDFGDAPPPSAPTPPPAPVTPAPDDLVSLRGAAFTAAAEATLARAFPRTPSTSSAVRTPKSNIHPTPTLEQAVARAATFARSPAFAGVLDACGVGATPTELRARIGPKAWESSPARQDLIAALRGSGARPHTRLDHRATKEANAEAGRDAEASDETNVVATARLFHGLELREATTVEAEESRGIVPAEASSVGDRLGEEAPASELTVTETPGGPVEPVDDFGAFEGEAVGETVAVPAAAAAEEEEEFADFAVAEAPASELTVTETPGGPVEPADDFGAFEGEAVGETVAVPAAAAAEEEEEFADFAVAEAPASELTVTETPGGPVEPVDDFGAFEGEAVGETVAVPAAAAAEEEEEFADFAVAEAPASELTVTETPGGGGEPADDFGAFEGEAVGETVAVPAAAAAEEEEEFADFAVAEAPAADDFQGSLAPEPRPVDDSADLFGPMTDAPLAVFAPVAPVPSAASSEADTLAASAASAAPAVADDGFGDFGDFAGADASPSMNLAAIPPAIEVEHAPVGPEPRPGPVDDFADLFGPIQDAPIRLEASSVAAKVETDAFGDFNANPPPTPSASDPFGEMISCSSATVKPAAAFDFDAFAASPAPSATRDDDDIFGAFGSAPALEPASEFASEPALEPAHASAAEGDFSVFASAGGVFPATPAMKSREAVADPFAGIDVGDALSP